MRRLTAACSLPLAAALLAGCGTGPRPTAARDAMTLAAFLARGPQESEKARVRAAVKFDGWRGNDRYAVRLTALPDDPRAGQSAEMDKGDAVGREVHEAVADGGWHAMVLEMSAVEAPGGAGGRRVVVARLVEVLDMRLTDAK
jgi:hypothetical protein